MVTAREAAFFAPTFAEAQNTANNTCARALLRDVIEKIREAAAATFGADGTSVEVVGSLAKRTNVGSSDVDVLVHTPNPASPVQFSQLLEALAAMFGKRHVHLGDKAIHVATANGDVDVVCSRSERFGEMPRPDPLLVGGPSSDSDDSDGGGGSGGSSVTAVRHAVRALKLWSRRGAAGPKGKVSGRWLEEAALAAFRGGAGCRHPFPPSGCDVLSGGGMQLFVSVLQTVADSPSPFPRNEKLLGQWGGSPGAATLRTRALQALHIAFLVARPVRGGFTSANQARSPAHRCRSRVSSRRQQQLITAASEIIKQMPTLAPLDAARKQVNAWVQNACDDAVVPSAAGPIPSWLVTADGRPATAASPASGFFKEFAGEDEETTAPSAAAGAAREGTAASQSMASEMEAIRRLAESPAGRYTLEGAKNTGGHAGGGGATAAGGMDPGAGGSRREVLLGAARALWRLLGEAALLVGYGRIFGLLSRKSFRELGNEAFKARRFGAAAEAYEAAADEVLRRSLFAHGI